MCIHHYGDGHTACSPLTVIIEEMHPPACPNGAAASVVVVQLLVSSWFRFCCVSPYGELPMMTDE